MRTAMLAAGLLIFWGSTFGQSDIIVRPDGLGNIKVGITAKQLSKLLGEPYDPPADPDDRYCYYVEAKKYPRIHFMIENSRLRRIDVLNPDVATSDGVKIGSTVASVKSLYGKKLRDEPHFYSGPEDRYLTIKFQGGRYATRFETNAGKIENFYSGFSHQISYVEGCL